MTPAQKTVQRRRAGPKTRLVPPTSDLIATKPGEATSSAPYLLDFFPLQDPAYTGLSRFFETLKKGRLSTTRCRQDQTLMWPPRTVCPKCHTEDVEWVDLPKSGRVYAFSAVLAGAPLGMEKEVPFVVGLVDLDGIPLRIFGRIEGRPWTACHVGLPVEVEPFARADGRVFYRFRARGTDSS